MATPLRYFSRIQNTGEVCPNAEGNKGESQKNLRNDEVMNMTNEKITRKNPTNMPSPVGNYTHITKIPRNAELFVTSGQVGVDVNGQFPDTLNEQVTNTFHNIKTVMQSEDLQAEHIIKVNVWATEKIDWDYLYGEWEQLFDHDYPAMTIGYITELGLPEIKIEIEIWAAKL
jgi:enamine deaminase RidA (YjgF/YER057c/UK114 family)